jgi:1,4-alpha-glucan branching enzyme
MRFAGHAGRAYGREVKGVRFLITKKPVAGGSGVEVTFTLPLGAGRVSVAGDFNEWDESATPLRTHGDTCSATVAVEGGRCYAFRYVDERGRWFNDDVADSYEPNSFGGYNGVIDLTEYR